MVKYDIYFPLVLDIILDFLLTFSKHMTAGTHQPKTEFFDTDDEKILKYWRTSTIYKV